MRRTITVLAVVLTVTMLLGLILINPFPVSATRTSSTKVPQTHQFVHPSTDGWTEAQASRINRLASLAVEIWSSVPQDPDRELIAALKRTPIIPFPRKQGQQVEAAGSFRFTPPALVLACANHESDGLVLLTILHEMDHGVRETADSGKIESDRRMSQCNREVRVHGNDQRRVLIMLAWLKAHPGHDELIAKLEYLGKEARAYELEYRMKRNALRTATAVADHYRPYIPKLQAGERPAEGLLLFECNEELWRLAAPDNMGSLSLDAETLHNAVKMVRDYAKVQHWNEYEEIDKSLREYGDYIVEFRKTIPVKPPG